MKYFNNKMLNVWEVHKYYLGEITYVTNVVLDSKN